MNLSGSLYIISFLSLFLAILLIITLIIFRLNWFIPNYTSTNTCFSTCPSDTTCIPPFCTPSTCLISNDCPSSSTCISNICITSGSSCQSNSECNGLSCINNICIQCTNTSDCPIGQACTSDHVCKYPKQDDIIPNMTVFPSPANERGNITAPSAYACSSSTIGCPYYVNNNCRCVPGVEYETCNSNHDCESGVCLNNICSNPGGKCTFDSDCPNILPYCSNGVCSNNSLGSACSGFMNNCIMDGNFCVNGRCTDRLGHLNSQCSSGSCIYGTICQDGRCKLNSTETT